MLIKDIADNPVLQIASRLAMVFLLAIGSLITFIASDMRQEVKITQAQQTAMLQSIAEMKAEVEYDHQALMRLSDNYYGEENGRRGK